MWRLLPDGFPTPTLTNRKNRLCLQVWKHHQAIVVLHGHFLRLQSTKNSSTALLDTGCLGIACTFASEMDRFLGNEAVNDNRAAQFLLLLMFNMVIPPPWWQRFLQPRIGHRIDRMHNIPYRKHSNKHMFSQRWINCKLIRSMDAWDDINTSFIAVIWIIKEIVQLTKGLLVAQMLSCCFIKDTSLYNKQAIVST